MLTFGLFWFFQPYGQQQLSWVFLFRPMYERLEVLDTESSASLVFFADMTRGGMHDEQFEFQSALAEL